MHWPALMLTILISGYAAAQTISATNGTSNPCGNCVPSGWVSGGGTPDISNATTAASSTTSGGGAKWSENQDGGGATITLPNPPNNHNTWLSLRDIGNTGLEESVYTTLSGLTVGREYEIVVYALTSTTKTVSSTYYAPRYIDKFSFEVVGTTQVVDVDMTAEPQKNWVVKKLRFIATATSHTLYLRPGRDVTSITSSARYETIQLSVTLNAINTVPVARDDSASTAAGTSVTINVLTNDSEYDSGQSLVPASVDLDPTIPGIQNTFSNSQGSWSVDNSGAVTFTPVAGFIGIASIPYTVQDNYTVSGSNPLTSAPGTSSPANISITIEATCTNSGITSVNLNTLLNNSTPLPSGVEVEWWTSPTRDLDPANMGTKVTDPANVTISGTYYAFYHDMVNNCYNTDNSTAKVVVKILPPCACLNNPASPGIGGTDTKVGITLLKRAGAENTDNWPMLRKSGHIALESNTKGFVITRMAKANLGNVTKPQEGMMVYDTTDKCLKIYSDGNWKCFNVLSCP